MILFVRQCIRLDLSVSDLGLGEGTTGEIDGSIAEKLKARIQTKGDSGDDKDEDR